MAAVAPLPFRVAVEVHPHRLGTERGPRGWDTNLRVPGRFGPGCPCSAGCSSREGGSGWSSWNVEGFYFFQVNAGVAQGPVSNNSLSRKINSPVDAEPCQSSGPRFFNGVK